MNAILGALKSKTVWVGVLTVIVTAIADPVQAWISAHPGATADLFGALMVGLRSITTSSLSAKAGPSA
jgi:hypothetical protein